MTDEIVIISPESTPGAGGVGDYALKLLAHWPSLPNLRLFVPKVSRGRGTDAISKQLPATGGKILVQYSAYGFDRAGYPRKLIRALIDWKTKAGGRLVVMFHEIWTFWPIVNKNFIVQFFHRRSIKRLLDCADVVFTSTSSQAEHLRALSPRAQVHLLPVGSNIQCNEDVDLARKPGWAVLFGLQRARIRALRKMQSSLSSLAAAGRITKIVTVGANGDGNAEERSLLAGLALGEGFEQRGPQSERAISDLLLTASFGISDQDKLSYSKSGTFMAYAAHGLNIVAARADRSKEEPLCLLIDRRELLQGVSEAELKLRAERLRAWQKRTSSWDFIAAKFAEALQASILTRKVLGCTPVPRVRENKLLLVSPCQGTYGGIEAFVLAVAEAVRREPDFEVRVCFKKVKDFALHPNLTTMLRDESFTFVESASRELARAIKWAGIVHLQNASPDVIAIAKFFRKPIVLTIHNYVRREWSLHRLLWRISARWADARWYNSDFVWKTWEGNRKRHGSRKVHTVSKLPVGWIPPDQRRGFVFVGRWIPNKGIETLVDAYAQASLDRAAWPLLLIGDGPLRPAIEARIKNHGLRETSIVGFVDEANKAQCMQKARWIVVPPNTNEDFGLTAIEARNLGVPCIITRDGGLPEAGGDQALVCEPDDPPALANLLEQAARMSETEYAERSRCTLDELKDELEPIDFYARSYRRILAQEPAD